MRRKEFLRLGLTVAAGSTVAPAFSSPLSMNSKMEKAPVKMPVLFMGHGSPMNALEDNEFTRNWKSVTADFPTPRAIMVISAHWETKGTHVCSVASPKTIHDFYGFPKELQNFQYPAQGSPQIAQELVDRLTKSHISANHDWGLDHGAWSVLSKMYPEAEVPCFQLSLDKQKDLAQHYQLAQELSYLRSQGVLILASGNIVHNLRTAQFNLNSGFDWAIEFDEKSKELMDARNHQQLIKYKELGKPAELSINTAEHYIPLIYALGLQEDSDQLVHFNEKIVGGSASMRCVRVG